ncbi:MAG TPA: hypothetical protein VGK52_00785 [Polyangia bacterium]
MWLPALTVLLVCLAAQGCILFTPSVTSPPSVKILPPNGPIFRGQTLALSADVSDPDGGRVNLEWTTSMGACPQPLDASQRPTTMPVGGSDADPTFSFALQPGDPATLCVWVLATDAQGATAVDAMPISSQNRAAVATIEVLAPTTKTAGGLFELYSVFHLSAAKSHDPDGDVVSDPQFALVGFPPAAMPTPKLVPCPAAMPSDLLACLDVGGFAGTYTISLTVSDGFTRSDAATATLTVDDDHPACVSGTDPGLDASPIVLDPSEGKTFSVEQILDDGAPLPTPADGAHAAPTFAWKVRRNAGAWQPIVGYDHINAFKVTESTYATGDVVDVSVTISDGVVMHLQPACDPRCPAGCPQSAQWTVEYR